MAPRPPLRHCEAEHALQQLVEHTFTAQDEAVVVSEEVGSDPGVGEGDHGVGVGEGSEEDEYRLVHF